MPKLLLKYVFLLPASLLLGSCDLDKDDQLSQQVRYVKDSRTNLCFAVKKNVTKKTEGFTEVPCTPLVEKEIERTKSK